MTSERGGGRGQGAGQPQVGATVRYRVAPETDEEAVITVVHDRRTVDLRRADGSEVTSAVKGGRVGGWRPLEDDEEVEEEATEGEVEPV